MWSRQAAGWMSWLTTRGTASSARWRTCPWQPAKEQLEVNLFAVALNDPGGPADHAQAAFGKNPQHLFDRRKERPASGRLVSRLQVRPRRSLRQPEERSAAFRD